MTCIELFELFFSNDLLDIITETRNYALFKNSSDPQVTLEKLKVFLGILLFSGINVLPSKRHYWENSKDVQNVMIPEAMRRDRFFQICKYVRFADNNSIDVR